MRPSGIAHLEDPELRDYLSLIQEGSPMIEAAPDGAAVTTVQFLSIYLQGLGGALQNLRVASHYLWLRDCADRVTRRPLCHRYPKGSGKASGSKASHSAIRTRTSTSCETSTSRSLPGGR